MMLFDANQNDEIYKEPEIQKPPMFLKNNKEYEIKTLEDGTRYWEDEDGVRRDVNTQHLVKGTAPIPGSIENSLANRTTKKGLKELQEYLRKRFGADQRILVDGLIKIALYDIETAKEDHINKYKDYKSCPKFEPTYKPQDIFNAIKLLMQYSEVGPPPQKIETTKEISVQVEHRMSGIAKLLQQNRDHLKLIDGGKDIEDAEIINEQF